MGKASYTALRKTKATRPASAKKRYGVRKTTTCMLHVVCEHTSELACRVCAGEDKPANQLKRLLVRYKGTPFFS